MAKIAPTCVVANLQAKLRGRANAADAKLQAVTSGMSNQGEEEVARIKARQRIAEMKAKGTQSSS